MKWGEKSLLFIPLRHGWHTSGDQLGPMLERQSPAMGAGVDPLRCTVGPPHPPMPGSPAPLWFGEQAPALLSAPSFGLKLAHKFLGCLVGASNRQFKPDVSSCRGPSPLASACVCPRGGRTLPRGDGSEHALGVPGGGGGKSGSQPGLVGSPL